MLSDLLRMILRAASVLSKVMAGVFLLFVAAEAALVGILSVIASIRQKRREGPEEPFPREEPTEIEMEASDERMEIFCDYPSTYAAMFEEMEKAEHTIFIETFTWLEDEVGRRFVETLARKAREGVEVYAAFDELANITQSAAFKEFPEEIHTLRFRPFSRPRSFLNPHNYVRSHRKTLTVDGRVAFVGGCNIGGVYCDGWRDTHLRVRGSLVHDVENAFAGFWNEHRSDDLPEIELSREEVAWNPSTTLRTNDPTTGLFPIRAMFLGPINRASKRIYLTSIYMIPAREIKLALVRAAERGVDVQILLPAESDYPFADWFARRHYTEPLRAGVRIFEYDEHYTIHTKTTTIDGAWSTVGSANIDSLSMFVLHETNLEIFSERFAEQMERIFETDKTNAREMTLEEWENRPLSHKLVEGALAPLRPFA